MPRRDKRRGGITVKDVRLGGLGQAGTGNITVTPAPINIIFSVVDPVVILVALGTLKIVNVDLKVGSLVGNTTYGNSVVAIECPKIVGLKLDNVV